MVKNNLSKWFLGLKLSKQDDKTAIKELVALCGATEGIIHYNKEDTSGELHDVVEVNATFVSRMEQNAAKYKLFFCVFVQEDVNKGMEPYPLVSKGRFCRSINAVSARREPLSLFGATNCREVILAVIVRDKTI